MVLRLIFPCFIFFMCLTLGSCSQLWVRHRVDSMEEHLRDSGQDVYSVVGVNKSFGGDPVVTSRAAWLRAGSALIKEGQVHSLFEAKWGSNEVTMFTAEWIDEVIEYYESERESVKLGFEHAERAFSVIERWFYSLNRYNFNFLLLMSDLEHGVSYHAESSLDDLYIRMVVSPKPLMDSDYLAGSFLATIAHELTHLNHQLADLEKRQNRLADQESRAINREATAHIVEWCAFEFFRSVKLGRDYQPFVPDLQKKWVEDAFPGLTQGQFNPVRKQILGMSTSEDPYRKMAYAVYSIFANALDFSEGERRALQPLLSYCETIANRAPDFMSGQLCPEGTSRMPGTVPACEPGHKSIQSRRSTE